MQIQILKPSVDGKHYANFDELIRNARDDEEREYLIDIKKREEEWKAKGYNGLLSEFAFGLIYTTKMACGHYEIFQHPIYRDYGKEPTEEDVMESIEHMIRTVRETKRDHMKCTRCTCNWFKRE